MKIKEQENLILRDDFVAISCQFVSILIMLMTSFKDSQEAIATTQTIFRKNGLLNIIRIFSMLRFSIHHVFQK